MKKAFSEMEVEIIPLSESISLRASDYVEMYSLSHSMEMADALIAGTCMEENEIFVAANDKHYRVVEGRGTLTDDNAAGTDSDKQDVQVIS